MATFRKGNYVADLGAMVVTGLGETLHLSEETHLNEGLLEIQSKFI